VSGEKKHRTIIRVKVLPRSSRDEIAGVEDGIVRIKLTAPPVQGKANKALIKLLAKHLGVPKQSIAIVAGERARLKSVAIEGVKLVDLEKPFQDS
jgi:uncharacterized protein (TIGR00251 family)